MKKNGCRTYPERRLISCLVDMVGQGNIISDLSGHRVRIARLGPYNRSFGPDFRNCAISVDGEMIYGDIEVDMDTSGWLRHGHFNNPEYDHVVLLVTASAGRNRTRILTRCGLRVRILVLPCITEETYDDPDPDDSGVRSWIRLPCMELSRGRSMTDIRTILIRQGMKRLRDKTAMVRRYILLNDDPTSAYYGLFFIFLGRHANIFFHKYIMDCLGLRLFRKENSPTCILGSMLHVILRHNIQFNRSGLRPNDTPEKRLLLLENCLKRDPERNLWDRITGILSSTGGKEGYRMLLNLMVESGLPTGRAQLVIVNVILPLYNALNPSIFQRTLAAWLVCPPVEKHSTMSLFEGLFENGIGWEGFKSEVEQQGCLRIHDRYCLNFCGGCPFLDLWRTCRKRIANV